MTTEKLQQLIDNWLYYNRPELQPTDEFTDGILNELKDELYDLNNQQAEVIVTEYLRLNYGNIAYEIILEVLAEDEFEHFRGNLEKTIPFIAHGEHESIVKEVARKRIVEKYGSTYDELIDNKPLYEEIRQILRARDADFADEK